MLAREERMDEMRALVDPLAEAFRLVHRTYPEGMEPWYIAKRIVEALDDPHMIPDALAKECVYEITNGTIKWPNEETRVAVVSFAEEQARAVFPELARSDEPHMAEIEHAYLKWKEKMRS